MLHRKTISLSDYKGHAIDVKYCGPDLLCHVNSVELPNFFLNVEAAKAAGKQYVNEKLKEQETA